MDTPMSEAEAIFSPDYIMPDHLRYANWRELVTGVFDLETTALINDDGTAPDDFRIIEFCCYIYKDEKLKSKLSFLINPGFQLSEKTTEITGITDAMLAGRPKWDEPCEEFAGRTPAEHVLDFMLDADLLVAYNGLTFDIPGLNSELKRAGQPEIMLPCVDPLPWARVRRSMKGPNRLMDECKRYGVSVMADVAHGQGGMHRADVDVKALAGYLWSVRQPWPFTLGEVMEDQHKHHVASVEWRRKTSKKRKKK